MKIRICNHCTKTHYALGLCRSHYNRQRKYGHPLAETPSCIPMVGEHHKVCSRCKQVKALTEFYVSYGKTVARCKPCQCEAVRMAWLVKKAGTAA